MITLNKIREFIINQDKELEALLFEYIMQNNSNIYDNLEYSKKRAKSKIEKLINEGNIDEAKTNIEEYKNKFDVDVTIYSMEGIIYLQKGDFNKALSLFKLGLEIDSNNVDILYNIAYTYTLLNDIQNSIAYYNKCLELTNDSSLIEEIKSILQNLNNKKKVEKQTLIYIGIENDDIIHNCINNNNYDLIKILLNEESETSIDYDCNRNKIYTTNKNDFEKVLEFIIRKHENCIIITNNINFTNNIKNLKDRCKIIYYTNNNLYIDKSDYLNSNIKIYMENEICNICDFIFTNNISVYTFKKILEGRDNIYLFNNSGFNKLDINYILEQNNSISDKEILKDIELYSETINDNYVKSIYKIVINYENIDECIKYIKNIYELYNTEEIYKIYLFLLNKSNNYEDIYKLVMNSEFCDDIYKLEIKYLKSNNYYSLINFIVNLSIKVYKNIDNYFNDFTEYKIANYRYELNMFKQAYDNYIEIMESNNELKTSPLVIRNISYLMYANENKDYEKFYNNYKELIKDLY